MSLTTVIIITHLKPGGGIALVYENVILVVDLISDLQKNILFPLLVHNTLGWHCFFSNAQGSFLDVLAFSDKGKLYILLLD